MKTQTIWMIMMSLALAPAGRADELCNGAFGVRLNEEQREALAYEVNLGAAKFAALNQELSKAIIGQEHLVNRLMIALLTNGHILLEGLPGLAKTTAIKAMASGVEGKFSRIQFTSDLLPADVVGSVVFNSQLNEFIYKKGPVFANFLLADEINRASGKVQSGMLQLMEEKIVTVGDNTERLPKPFVVMATQNPIDQEGTYKLPEAQMDRFLMKVNVTYPKFEDELLVIARSLQGEGAPQVNAVMSIEEVLEFQKVVSHVEIPVSVGKYILSIVSATRDAAKYGLPSKFASKIKVGASPRGGIGLAQAAKALAFLRGRTEVTIADVQDLAVDVLVHRLTLTYEAEMEGVTKEMVIQEVLRVVKPE